MINDLKAYEKSIQKKHSFHWEPYYEEEFKTTISELAFVPVATAIFETLQWQIQFIDGDCVAAGHLNSFNVVTEEIRVTYAHGKIKVKSTSAKGMWDMGKNSVRVKLFIHAFKQKEKSYDHEALKALEEATERKNNWDDYKIPEGIAQPTPYKIPDFKLAVLVSLLTAIGIGILMALLTVNVTYVIGLYEMGAAFVLAYSLLYCAKLGNYTNYIKLRNLLITIVALTYITNEVTQTLLVMNEYKMYNTGFWFMFKLRFNAGLQIKDIDTGSIGLVICWIVQLVATYYIAHLRMVIGLNNYSIARVPEEVIDFAYYHMIKGKTESEIRTELNTKGWQKPEQQNEVFEAIGAIYEAKEFNRPE